MNRWIGPDGSLSVGDMGFLVFRTHNLKGWKRYDIQNTPAHTNQSHRPRLNGWCGTTNDVAVYACGMARVERLAKNGRALVRELTGDEITPVLETLGYPELIEE